MSVDEHRRGDRWWWALLALWLSGTEVWAPPGRGAVRGGWPPEVEGVFIFVFVGGGQEALLEFVEELVGGSPLPGGEFAVVGRGGGRGLGVWAGGAGGESSAVELARFVVVQPQRLELGGGAAYIGPDDVSWVWLAPLDAHRLAVGL